MRFVLLLVLFFVTTCTTSLPNLATPEVRGPSIIPLAVHYLTDEKDIRTKFEQSLELSNQTLMPHGIGLLVWSEDRLYRLPEKIMTRQDRQRLGGFVSKDGTLHIFVADAVSVEPGDGLNGLHSNMGHRDFVILATKARKTTLAHEVGHALGLDHETEEDNVMCTNRDDKGARFSFEQGELMRDAARKYVMRDWGRRRSQ